MQPRRAVAVIAALVLGLGVLLSVVPVSIPGGGIDVDCGSVFSPSISEALDREIEETFSGGPVLSGGDYLDRCDERLSGQSAIVWPLVGLGGLALVYLFLTTQHTTRWDAPEPANDETPRPT